MAGYKNDFIEQHWVKYTDQIITKYTQGIQIDDNNITSMYI